jgi:predicted patatin/cPLA2 family phospholipase
MMDKNELIHAGLVLEGGGMRGIFTAGVLDCFLEHALYFDSCIGVSAGACHACSYLAGQHGRAFRTAVDYIGDRHYCSLYSLLTTGDLFGAKMLYEDIPRTLYPIDNPAFQRRGARFQVTVTNCITGQAEYPQIHDLMRDIQYVRASSSMPFVSRMVVLNGVPYLDGGIADSIPIRQSIRQGNLKNVVILTQPCGYRKQPNRLGSLAKLNYRKYPRLTAAIERRHLVYNDTLAFLRQEELSGSVFVLRPEAPLGLSRTEKDLQKLTAAYDLGHAQAEKQLDALGRYLGI